MIIGDILKIYSNKLKDLSDTPRLDVEMLLCKALGDVDRIYIHMNIDKEIDNDKEQLFKNMFKDRLQGRPIAYILNNREFMGLDFFVKEGVLIPRPDTEILVEEILHIYKNKKESVIDKTNKELNIVEIGTGSGAIAVSLAKYIDYSSVLSLDISEEALEIGKRNAVNNGVKERVDFRKSDLFSAIENGPKKFDFIVSNPPYIRREDMKTLQKQVKDFEPSLALDGGVDGLDFYRNITRESKKYLKQGAVLAFEVGHDQAEDVSNILKKEGFKKIYTKKDLQLIDRVVIGFNL